MADDSHRPKKLQRSLKHSPVHQETTITSPQDVPPSTQGNYIPPIHTEQRNTFSFDSPISDFEKNERLEYPRAHHGNSRIPAEIPNQITPTDSISDEEKDIEKDADARPSQSGPPSNQLKDPNLIEWEGPYDKGNPQNWPIGKKWAVTLTMGSMTWVITFASSVFSTATMVTSKQFHVSEEVMVLGTSLFVLGFAVGPLLWGPFSELYGRKVPLFFGYLVFAIFQIPVAVAQNLQTIFICRFFGGMFGSAPLAVVGGALADFWDPVNRGIATAIFSGATFVGPVAGPIVGSFITTSYLGWRWTEYITSIMAFFFGAIGFLVIPETYGPVLLQRRAKDIRHETKNWAIHSKMDENKIDLRIMAYKYLGRPFLMLVLEPILILITIYMALIYGIIYLFFEAYPIAFSEVRGWSPGVGSLPFLAITVGVILGGALIAYTSKTRFARKLKQHGRVVPEERLIPMIVGGAVLPAGLFWFAWTSSPNISPWPQIISGVPIGMGVLLIFLQGLNYIIDVYLMNANSAIAANTLFRSCVGAGFPLFATAM